MTEPGSSKKGDHVRIDPVVAAALRNLSTSINFPLHPYDRGRTIELFRILHSNGIPFSPSEVGAWFLETKGWTEDLTQEITAIAERVVAGKTFRGVPKGPYWEESILEQWKAEAGT